jgi:hypothetical protein
MLEELRADKITGVLAYQLKMIFRDGALDDLYSLVSQLLSFEGLSMFVIYKFEKTEVYFKL